MVVVARRLVRRSRKVVRSITLVVHHIQAAHSDEVFSKIQSEEARSLPRAHTGCTPGASGASIYAQTHTMAMPSDNAPPAAHCAADTPGHKRDRNVIKSILKMVRKNIFDRSSGRFCLRTDCFQPADCLFWRGVIFRKGWGPLRTPTGEGPVRGAVEFNEALTLAANLGLCDWCSFIKANLSVCAACICGSHLGYRQDYMEESNRRYFVDGFFWTFRRFFKLLHLLIALKLKHVHKPHKWI